MPEIDRRGFLRLRRRSQQEAPQDAAEQAVEEDAKQTPPPPADPELRKLYELTASLLADVESENARPLAEGALATAPKDKAYMRVTTEHIVFSVVTGFSAFIKTSDVTAFNTDPPLEVDEHRQIVIGVINAHHPADPPTVTRSVAFRFPAESLLLPAIRTACNIPEPQESQQPEEPAEDENEPADPEGE
jgi:hypothetical protein